MGTKDVARETMREAGVPVVAFEGGNVSKVAYGIVFMVLIIIALNSFHVAIDYTYEAITTMVNFIIALIPLLLALIAASGGLISAAFFHHLRHRPAIPIDGCRTDQTRHDR